MTPPRVYPHAGDGDRRAALRVAHDVLSERWPQVQVPCIITIAPNRFDAIAVLHFPGFVRVSMRHSGELVAQSRPGQPLVLDDAAW